MPDKINDGDYVVLMLDPHRTYMVKVEHGKIFHTHKGYIQMDDIIGKEYGLTVKSSLGASFAALKPTLNDYIMKSSRKTQITYPKDAALIVLLSSICAGSRVVESGTGTGALTTALAHYVKPTGKVYSYDVRREFQETAEKNLRRAGLIDYVELKNLDVTLGIAETNVDAVVLDLATPWLVVPHAFNALKPSGTLVSFSPTVDQALRLTEALKAAGFVGVETVECLLRGMQMERGKVRPQTLMTAHTGYITCGRKALPTESLLQTS
jgi:tRNA (adenine57-N1/adenine58-N1)-methyltransferase